MDCKTSRMVSVATRAYIERCKECCLPIPTNRDPMNIPCSEYHIRCERCLWPTAKSMMDEDGVCSICKGKKQ